MLCAHTVRKLKPGTFEQFVEAFSPDREDAPAGWVRFHMLRKLGAEDEVVTFGFFDGTLEELERSQKDAGYQDRRDSIDGFVDTVVANGVYEIVESWTTEGVTG